MWQKLQPREKLLLLIAAGLILVLLVFLVVRKIYRLRTDLSETVNNTPGLAAQLDKTISDYLFFRSLENSNTGENDQSAFAAKLERIFSDNGVKDRISTMRPIPAKLIDKNKYQVIVFEVNLRGVPLENVMSVLYDIDKGNKVNARVEYFQTNKPYQDKNTYDVNMKIAAYSVAPGK
ncbi:hypothetical protein [Leptospira licerasiae]|uniref:General secretion pathway protein GspM n=1 Tax=Leptospira licerasiae str. MMD4847 TaxID=1049971 RepID=A0ABP2RFG6_9LEPT|nr:hypothetical protein [Leptospira licerasiae]EIE01590.1 hypothetical protein LEP1GSC185_2930 [Leptospira licerasiae serovar Varillal str. VAR 010]EJZ43261.1 hypothetical protein LEP1GSC178_2547 [Leptospira licerasiae str. MMD4847]TGM86317.1 hypothetical protein EHR05_15285 [Leptospira licerasiae]